MSAILGGREKKIGVRQSLDCVAGDNCYNHEKQEALFLRGSRRMAAKRGIVA